MAKNKRRVEIATGTAAAASNSFIDMDFEKGQVVNVHGLRMEIMIEPEVGDANANGVWALWVLPGGAIQNSDLPSTYGAFANEDFAPYLWGIGVWGAANQTTVHILFDPDTSRNIQAGGCIVAHIMVNGLSGGLIRQNTLITCFTTPVA